MDSLAITKKDVDLLNLYRSKQIRMVLLYLRMLLAILGGLLCRKPDEQSPKWPRKSRRLVETVMAKQNPSTKGSRFHALITDDNQITYR